jgi:hypothetical protein
MNNDAWGDELDHLTTEQISDAAAEQAYREAEAYKRSFATPNPLDDLSTEQIRQLAERESQDMWQRGRQQLQTEAVNEFLARHPEYVANPTGGAAFTEYFADTKMQPTSVEEFEQAFKVLRERGRLTVDETKAQQVEQERKRFGRYGQAIANANREMLREEEFLKSHDPESMSLDDLRAYCNRKAREAQESDRSGISY